ncbi:ankyrin repeat domain-containing protein [Kutzneria sp. CA-103260]|uniref:ankyrin repeat domain-containing protein n=1 Tax=Kutzneria sp. CA-103260 TaxID=2802641 RepID=UPI001BA7B11C|nr:ankyrin repeat domain-containing protein [Kutzneria sp. CA-103260]QUQ62577.1 Ankyrin repeats (many copies) [Kutzneria sp. CA-103260]
MPTVSLPDDPSLEHLRHQARALHRAVRAGDAEALARVHRSYGTVGESFPLATAQLVVAREYGFASWAKLRQHLDVIDRYRWPRRTGQPVGGSPSDEFCRLACLTYSPEDDPARWAAAVLPAEPDIWAAAAAGDADRVAQLLASDRSLARREGGPHLWEPLCYLAYARVSQRDPLRTARILLAAGGNPDTGYLWGGLTTPFTLLTGAFGEGEQGPVRQPRHPQSLELAELLLRAGAEPNDGQALYNRMFGVDDSHLRLLFRYGLGRGEGGPWRARLSLQSPVELVQGQLLWAVSHNQQARVQLLVENGVEFPDGVVRLALLNGNNDIAAYLKSAGAPAPALDPVSEFVAAVLGGGEADPSMADQARAARPGLVVWAAANGRLDAVRRLVELGFDVNALGRGDTPIEQPWSTALHHAAADGNRPLVLLLLELGADPSIHDARFDATPAGWAEHEGHPELIELLTP